MSIIRKAGELNNTSTLVFGLPADGKTTAIMEHITENGYNPLWVVFTNADIIARNHPEWDVAIIPNWFEFDLLYKEMVNKKIDITQYDVVVIEGLGYAATMALTDILSIAETKDPRPSYLEMGRLIAAKIAGLRGLFKAVFVTLDLQRDDENNLEMSINRHLYFNILGFFGNKWYVYSEPKADKSGVNYIVQTDPTYALRFKPVQRKEG